jgi:hypothetical protein
MGCDDEMCLPPNEAEFPFVLTVPHVNLAPAV